MNNSYTTPTNAHSAGIIAVVYLVTFLLFTLPSLITTWRLYKKAGQPGWAAIVPIYSNLIQLQIAKMPTWYVVLLFVPLVNFVIDIMIIVNFAKQYNRKLGFWLAYIFLPIVAVFLVGKTEYTGGEAVTATAAPASPADTAALAPAPTEVAPEPVSESVAPIANTAPVDSTMQAPVAPAESIGVTSPAAPSTFGVPAEPVAETPSTVSTEPSTLPASPWEQPSTQSPMAPGAPAEEPVLQGFNMPAEPVVSPKPEQQPMQTEQTPNTTQQPPVIPPQQPLQ